ncbi:MAG: hypothetical protein WBA13_13610 [Microcoleaceae cyanobacterium]
MSESLLISEKLAKAWGKVDDIFLPNNSWWIDQGKCKIIQKKLAYFNSNHNSRPEHIDRVYKFISRGISLTQAAIDWENPAICGYPRSNTGKNRGIQWKLVIAYSGFEITTKGLMNYFENQSIKISIFKDLLKKCKLPNYSLLNSPTLEDSKNLEKWLSREETAIANFLGLGREDAKIIKRWIVQGDPIDNWKDAFLLTKAFRNTTTHGFLVPSKVIDWKLKDSLQVLTNNLAEILTAALEKLES